MAKSKSKPKAKASPKTKKRGVTKHVAQRRTAAHGAVSPKAVEFAKSVWPSMNKSTKFVAVPEFQTAVTYTLPSGESYTTTLKWFSVSHGSRILGHYDEAIDVCYVGQFIEG